MYHKIIWYNNDELLAFNDLVKSALLERESCVASGDVFRVEELDKSIGIIRRMVQDCKSI